MNRLFKYIPALNTVLLITILSSILFFANEDEIKDYIKSLSQVIPNEINNEIIEFLQSGDNSIILRHADDKTKNRESAFDIASLNLMFEDTGANTTALLSKKGQIQVKILKKFFDDYDIYINEVWSSPVLRCKQTALYFTEEEKLKSPLWLMASGLSGSYEEEKEKIVELFFSETKESNRMIVGHGGFQRLFGFDVDLGKSEMVVYNHKLKKPIYYGTILDIAKFTIK
tara:strand:- start:2385 stop:3068 length:684 start_codon:yes stop_codon:yes gene_type:complete